MSDENADALDLLVHAAKVRASLLVANKPMPPIPVKPVPATSLCPRKLPESGSFATLRPAPTKDHLVAAPQRLCMHRAMLIEDMNDEAALRGRRGNFAKKCNLRLSAISTDDEYVLQEGKGVRVNAGYRSVEVMEEIQEEKKNPWGESSLKHQVEQSAYTKGMVEGDIEQAAVMGVQEEVDKELEGVL